MPPASSRAAHIAEEMPYGSSLPASTQPAEMTGTVADRTAAIADSDDAIAAMLGSPIWMR